MLRLTHLHIIHDRRLSFFHSLYILFLPVVDGDAGSLRVVNLIPFLGQSGIPTGFTRTVIGPRAFDAFQGGAGACLYDSGDRMLVADGFRHRIKVVEVILMSCCSISAFTGGYNMCAVSCCLSRSMAIKLKINFFGDFLFARVCICCLHVFACVCMRWCLRIYARLIA